MDIQSILDLVNGYVVGEIILLVPILIYLGSVLKKTSKVHDTLIPDILCLVAIPVVAIYNVSTNTPTSLHEWVVLGLVSCSVGIVLGTTSVGLNQLKRQHQEGKLEAMFNHGMDEEVEE